MDRRTAKTALVVLIVVALAALLYAVLARGGAVPGPGPTSPAATHGRSMPTETAPTAPAPQPSRPAGATKDYYAVVGKAVVEHQDLAAGSTGYCAADELGRARCAYGLLTPTLRAEAKARGRQDIEVDPAGWPAKNPKVTITANDQPGSKNYRGYLWNRSHLLADSLGGDAIANNLVTGTRTQNVGSTQAGGMAYTEEMARNYLDSDEAEDCPLYYAAVPQYVGSELVPRTVTVDVRSCGERPTIDVRVVVDNAANGWTIDYARPEASHQK